MARHQHLIIDPYISQKIGWGPVFAFFTNLFTKTSTSGEVNVGPAQIELGVESTTIHNESTGLIDGSNISIAGRFGVTKDDNFAGVVLENSGISIEGGHEGKSALLSESHNLSDNTSTTTIGVSAKGFGFRVNTKGEAIVSAPPGSQTSFRVGNPIGEKLCFEVGWLEVGPAA